MKTISTPTGKYADLIINIIGKSAIIVSMLMIIAGSSANAKTSLNRLLNTKVIFRIAGHPSANMKNNLETEFSPVTKTTNENEYGAYKDYSSAKKAESALSSAGLQQTEMRAYFNANRISLNDALYLITNFYSDAQESDADQYQSSATMPLDQMEQLMKMVAATEYYYTVTFEDGGKDFSQFPELNGHTSVKTDGNGKQVISFGNFTTYESAVAYVDLIRGMGMKNVKVSAWGDQGQPISLQTAGNYEAIAMAE